MKRDIDWKSRFFHTSFYITTTWERRIRIFSCCFFFITTEPDRWSIVLQYNVSQKWDSRNLEYLVHTVVSLFQGNLARDILMTLAIKRIHNLPPNLGNVSTLPDITQNQNKALTSWSRGSLTRTWDRIPQGIIDEASGKHGCMHV